MFAALNESLLGTWGEEVTFQQADSTITETIIVLLQSAREIEALEPSAHAGVFLRRSDLSVEPKKGDKITIPAGRQITAGDYRIARINPDGEGTTPGIGDGRTLFLQYIRP